MANGFNNLGYGIGQGVKLLANAPVVAHRAPTANDVYPIGQLWCDVDTSTSYILAAPGTWTTSPGTSGSITATDITVTPGNVDITDGDLAVTLGDFSVGGNAVITGNLDVTGDLTVTGDFDITSASALSFTTTSNTDPAISFTTNGGTTETIIFTNTQGTAADAIDLESTAGGVKIFAGGAAMSLQAVNQSISLVTGTGALNLGADAVAHTINIGNAVGATAVAITSGTGHVNIASTGTGDILIDSDDTLLLDADGVLELNSSAGVISIGNDADANNINIGTGAAARVITIGNVTGASQVVLNSGTAGVAINTTGAGDFVVTSADTVLIDSAGVLELNSSAGAISIGNDAVAQAINMGTGAAARTITVGNITGATAVNVNSGTGGFHVVSTTTGDITLASADTVLIDSAGVLELNSSAGVIGIGNDAVAQAINIGTGAAARTITVGNVTGATGIVLNSGTGGVAVNTTGAGDIVVASADTVLIDSAGVLELNSSAGVISIGNDAVAQNINIGTGAAARVLTLGNITGATAVNINTGTAGSAITTTNGVFTVATGTGTVTVSGDATANTLNIGTGAGVKTLTLGSTNSTSVTTVQSGTGGLILSAAGAVSMVPATATVASPTAASTTNSRVGRVIFTGFTTASAATQPFTITNSTVTATSGIFVTVAHVRNVNANIRLTVEDVDVAAAGGSFIVKVTNNGADALDGNVILTWWIIS